MNSANSKIFDEYGIIGVYGPQHGDYKNVDIIEEFDEEHLKEFLRRCRHAGVKTEGCRMWGCDTDTLCLVGSHNQGLSEFLDTVDMFLTPYVFEDELDTEPAIAGTVPLEALEEIPMWEDTEDFYKENGEYQQVSLQRLAKMFNDWQR